MATPNVVPRADGEGGLGSSSKYWGASYINLIYLGAGKIGRDAHNLIDFSTDNSIQFRASDGIRLFLNSVRLAPHTSNELALGAADKMWSDLFLASGAVINFDNGNVTLTHSSGLLTLADNDILSFGSGSDLRISHDATNSIISNGTGDLFIQNTADDKDVIFRCDDGSGSFETYFFLDGSTGQTRFPDNKLLSLGTGGDLDIYHDGSNSFIQNTTGNLTIRNDVDDGDIKFQCDDGSGGTAEYFRIDGQYEVNRFLKNTRFNDNVKANFGTTDDLGIYHDGSHSYIENGTGSLFIRNNTNDTDIIFQSDSGNGGIATYFSLDGSSATHDGSATTALFTNWPDKSKISLGTSHDLQIFHDGTNSNIINAVGNLAIQNNADDGDIKFFSDDGSGGVTAYLTLDGGLGFTTVQKAMRFNDSVNANFGSSDDLQIQHNGANSEINNYTGSLNIINQTDDGNISFRSDDLSGGVTEYFRLDGELAINRFFKDGRFEDNVKARFGTGNDLQIYHDGTNSYIDNGTGHLSITQNADDSHIIFNSDDGSGGVTTYFLVDGSADRTVFTRSSRHNDGVVANFGTSEDLQIYHDGTDSKITNATGDLNITTATGDMYIANNANDKDIVLMSDDGSNGLTAYITLDGSEGVAQFDKNVKLPDGIRIVMGTGSDFQIFHDGSDGYIENTTGNLTLRNYTTDGDIILMSDDGSGGETAYITLDGSASTVEIAKDTNFAGDVSVTDSGKFEAGTGKDFKFHHDGTDGYLENYTGNINMRNFVADGDIIFSTDNGSGGGNIEEYFRLDGSAMLSVFSRDVRFIDSKILRFGAGSDLQIYHDGNNSNYITSTTSDIYLRNEGNNDKTYIQATNNGSLTNFLTIDGSLGYTVATRNIRFDDNVKALFGTNIHLQIFNDGSNSYISDSGTGDLYITAADNMYLQTHSSGKRWVTLTENAGVDLFHNDAVKLQTTSAGVTVTGSLTPSLGVTKPIASAAANVAAAVAGSIYTFSDADGAIVTLPDSGGGGLVGQTFEFVCTATATSNSHKVIFSDTTNEKFIGRLTAIDTDSDNAQLVYVPATANKAVVMNGTTTGITGSRFTITNVAADIWMIEGYVHHTGNTTSPFANS